MKNHHGAAFALLTLLVANPLAAQAPIVTPDGDPSVREDSIYALAVQPGDAPDASIAILLDDGIVRYEADGTGVVTYRTVAQVLKEDAVESYAEHTFGYDPDKETFRLNWARVIAPDGSVISAEPLHVQESDIPAAEGSPVYTARKQVRVSLAGVAPNTIVDFSYTRTTREPILEGDLHGSWVINPGVLVRRSRLLLDLPKKLDVHLHQVDVTVPPVTRTVGDRVVRTWARQELPARVAEPLAPDSNGITEWFSYGGAIDWARIGAWYDSLASDRYAATPALDRRLAELVDGAHTLDDSLRAIHRWIAQDVRYVSLSLGIGGYQPRMPDEVMATLSGDCKDKVTLFLAMARRMGLQAWPVLTNSYDIDRAVPAIEAIDHVVAAVIVHGDTVYADLTADLVPWRQLPAGLHGKTGLLVQAAQSRLLRFPDPPATDATLTMRLVGTLDESGAFDGRYEEYDTGYLEYNLRDAFASRLTKQQTQQVAQAVAGKMFQGAHADTLVAFDGRDLTARPALVVPLTAPRAASVTPDGDLILAVPLTNPGNDNILRYLERAEPRVAPYAIGLVSGDRTVVNEVRVTLPQGWTATLPPEVDAVSRFGEYHSTYEQVGNELRLTRRFVGGRGIAPPDATQELIGWLRQLASDDVRYVVISRD